MTLFGMIIGVIAAYKGLRVGGGAEGVGRAVNESVVDLPGRDLRDQRRLHLALPGALPGGEPRRMNSAPPQRRDSATASMRRRRAVAEAIERPERLPVIDAAGEYAGFVLGGVRGLRRVGDYAGEALRQAALIAAGSVLVIVCDLVHGRRDLRPRGLGDLARARHRHRRPRSSAPSAPRARWCRSSSASSSRRRSAAGSSPQLGSMRVNEEVDAMEVMGIPSITYLVSTRMLPRSLDAADRLPDRARGGPGRAPG